jgi:hypothetical protein
MLYRILLGMPNIMFDPELLKLMGIHCLTFISLFHYFHKYDIVFVICLVNQNRIKKQWVCRYKTAFLMLNTDFKF